MQKRPQGFTKSAKHVEGQNSQPGLPVEELARLIPDFIYDCKSRCQSPLTVKEEVAVLNRFLVFLQEKGATYCNSGEIRHFLTHVQEGGMQRGGRWGKKNAQPVRPRTVRNYWSYIRTFFNWISEEYPPFESPMVRVKPPIVRADQIVPFTDEQIKALIRAAKASTNPRRDEAIVLFLLDTGVRANELCTIRCRDLNLDNHSCSVLGKGDKRRIVHFGRDTKKALWRYLQDNPKGRDSVLFSSTRGTLAGDPLTRDGLRQLIERLGNSAGLNEVEGVRCSPHTFRHTSAIRFINNGGNVFTLQQRLGHTALSMTQKYVNLAVADLETQARQFSPVDGLRNTDSKY